MGALPDLADSPRQPPIPRETILGGLRVRELPEAEFHKLGVVLPEYRDGVDPRTARVVVAEDPTGKIVATWGVFATVHIEPLYIAQPHRKNPGLIRALWERVWGLLESTGQRVSFAVLAQESPALPLALRLDFEKIEGDLYWCRLRNPRGANT